MFSLMSATLFLRLSLYLHYPCSSGDCGLVPLGLIPFPHVNQVLNVHVQDVFKITVRNCGKCLVQLLLLLRNLF